MTAVNKRHESMLISNISNSIYLLQQLTSKPEFDTIECRVILTRATYDLEEIFKIEYLAFLNQLLQLRKVIEREESRIVSLRYPTND